MTGLTLCVLATCMLCASAQGTDTGADGDLVVFPYQEGEVGFKQYSGYLDVLPTRHIHYVYVESQGDPAKDPVVFWTNGGMCALTRICAHLVLGLTEICV